MKKLFTIICAIALGFSVSAQTWTERWTDESYMPEAGEWAIGIDATSTLNSIVSERQNQISEVFQRLRKHF